jgi:signal transduction histidine kinase
MRALVPMVGLAVADPTLRDAVSVALQDAGRVTGGEDIVPVAAVVITDAGRGAKKAVAAVRAGARSDATIIVIVSGTAPDSEIEAAYDAGAVLCLRAPVDEHQLLAVVGSAIDLRTARVQADDLMRQLDVQSHLAALGRVTSGFTHEVSNPLSVLCLNYDTVRESMALLLRARDLLARPTGESTRAAVEMLSRVSAGQAREALDDMGDALERIRSVLATTRDLAQAGLSGRMEDVDLAAVASEVRRWAAHELRAIDVQELIDEPITAWADPRLLRQIVLNLVTNAAHAAQQLPSPRLRIHVYGSADTAILSVRDNGPGMPPEIRDRVFEPFFTTRRATGGTGLGLALCREYAARMQARITLWTSPGRGSCFRVHMRRRPP